VFFSQQITSAPSIPIVLKYAEYLVCPAGNMNAPMLPRMEEFALIMKQNAQKFGFIIVMLKK